MEDADNTTAPIKRRGRPPGSKNKKKVEATEVDDPEENVPDIEDAPPANPEPPVIDTKPVAKRKARPKVEAEPQERIKTPSKRPAAAPRSPTPAPVAPTAQEIAAEMMRHIDDRHYSRQMQRKALYSSWV